MLNLTLHLSSSMIHGNCNYDGPNCPLNCVFLPTSSISKTIRFIGWKQGMITCICKQG